MQESLPQNPPAFSTVFQCPLLGREPGEWPSIEVAFASVAGIPLLQGWRGQPEEGFRRGWAKMARTEEALLVLAELEDDDVFNPVSALNEPAFLRGDVVELFVLPAGTDRYVELHSTPDGALLQLRWTVGWRDGAVPGTVPDLAQNLIASPVAKALTRRTPRGWSAFLAIPFALIGFRPGDAPWHGAVCRYDYTRGAAAPVLSATAPFRRVDFHHAALWNRVVFAGAGHPEALKPGGIQSIFP